MPGLDTLIPNLPFSGFMAGNSSERGIYVSPGARTILLCNSTSRTGDDPAVTARCYGGTQGTLAGALALCRANMGDTIFVLPGHSENVGATALAALVAGTRIIGVSTGGPNQDSAPTFTWNATTSTWAISVKNVEISGLRLLMDGANGVVAPINITAAGCRLIGNYMRWSSGASNLATTAITVGSGATDTVIAYNQVVGAAAGVCTDGIKLLGATTPDNTIIARNVMHAACTAANGLINVTVAAINVFISDNIIENVTASSSVGILTGAVACDGTCSGNLITIKNTGTLTSGTVGIKIGAGTLMGFFNNQGVNDPVKSGILLPSADT
jgi:hypothetical protein